MYRSIVLFAVTLPLIALALPSFHMGTQPIPTTPQLEKIFCDCSTECTGDRKAAEVLLARTPLFKSPETLKPFCEKSQCIEDCVVPQFNSTKVGFNIAKIQCTDENYAKSYECLNNQVLTVSAQCTSGGGFGGSEYCKVLVDNINCMAGGFTEKCGESGGQAYKRIGDEVLSAMGCKKPE